MTNVELAFESMINGTGGRNKVEIYKEVKRRPQGMGEDDAKRVEKGIKLAGKEDETKKPRGGCCG